MDRVSLYHKGEKSWKTQPKKEASPTRAHIMDPATGYPAGKHLAVTVITPLALDADWMSTAVFIRGKSLAEKITRMYPGTTVYIYSGSAADNSVSVEVFTGRK